MTAVAALVREPQFELWTATWIDMTAVVEPHLIVELAVLYALAPGFPPDALRGRLVIAAITVVVGVGSTRSSAGSTATSPLAAMRHILLALCVYGVLLVYFELRAKALSPAIAESRLQALQAGFARISCSTASTRCCRWCAPTRNGPRPRSSTWPTSFAC
jgi:two-component system sensor histidine kinase AlgZ